MKKILNIAYGSNLNLHQMAYRCPTAKVYGKGIIKNYRLLFKGSPCNAYATIEEYKGGEVPVLVWELKAEDEKNLDRYEGYPDFYDKKELKMRLETGKRVKAKVYIMTDKIYERIKLNLPSPSYLRAIREGYESSGFDTRVINEALKVSYKALKLEAPNNLL